MKIIDFYFDFSFDICKCWLLTMMRILFIFAALCLVNWFYTWLTCWAQLNCTLALYISLDTSCFADLKTFSFNLCSSWQWLLAMINFSSYLMTIATKLLINLWAGLIERPMLLYQTYTSSTTTIIKTESEIGGHCHRRRQGRRANHRKPLLFRYDLPLCYVASCLAVGVRLLASCWFIC